MKSHSRLTRQTKKDVATGYKHQSNYSISMHDDHGDVNVNNSSAKPPPNSPARSPRASKMPGPTFNVITANDADINEEPSKTCGCCKIAATKQQKILLDASKSTFWIWKLAVYIVAVSFVAAGITIISLTTSHFEQKNDQCSNPDSDTLLKHPELQVWDQCIFKTLPFGANKDDPDYINCNCRKAKIDLSPFSSTKS